MEQVLDIPKEFLLDDVGIHNGQIEQSVSRLVRGNSYKNLSTIWITPTRGSIHPRTVGSWMTLMRPMNQPFVGPIFADQDEVGEAYQKMFDMVLTHTELSKFQYILTVEEDNLPPADGVLKLYESIEKGYDCVAGLYWTKGEGGMPMIYGNPDVMPRNFVPQVPRSDTLQHCNGLGMGFNLWRIESLKTKLKDMPKPWFKTVQQKNMVFSQDLWFFNEAAKYGFKVACDTRVKVGHLDTTTGVVW
jgi:hypothetical protein